MRMVKVLILVLIVVLKLQHIIVHIIVSCVFYRRHLREIHRSIELMEALQVHAKKRMWPQYNDDESTTCGPVWNYETSAPYLSVE